MDGEHWLSDFIPRELRSCPAIKLTLVGYSQGAQATGDAYQRSVSRVEKRHIAAVLLFGDPYFNPRDRSTGLDSSEVTHVSDRSAITTIPCVRLPGTASSSRTSSLRGGSSSMRTIRVMHGEPQGVF